MNVLERQEIRGVLETSLTNQTLHIPQMYASMKMKITIQEKAWLVIIVTSPEGTIRAQGILMDGSLEFCFSEEVYSTSYSIVPGKISAGNWSIDLLNAIPKNISYLIEVEYGQDSLPKLDSDPLQVFATSQYQAGFTLNNWNPSEAVNTEQRWYKGDFHTHTFYSDGKLSPQEGITSAKEMGLDFFVATDHNIIPTKWLKDSALVIPGVEITSSKGHFNALGVRSWVDWRPTASDMGMESERGMNRILKEVGSQGALRSINHPLLRPWHWTFKETLLSEIDVLEIWNDPTFPDNVDATEQALVLWDTLLNDGYTIPGIGGSDSHMRPTESYVEGGPASLIGDPSTYVWANELSAQAILDSVKSGNVYVSRGQVLNPLFFVNGESVHMGENIAQNSDLTFKLNYQCTINGHRLVKVINGLRTEVEILKLEGTYEEEVKWKEGYHWIRYEIRSSNGELLAFMNPIFNGIKKQSLHVWADLLEKAGFNDD